MRWRQATPKGRAALSTKWTWLPGVRFFAYQKGKHPPVLETLSYSFSDDLLCPYFSKPT